MLWSFAITRPDGPSYRGVARIMRPRRPSAKDFAMELPADMPKDVDVEQVRKAIASSFRFSFEDGVSRAAVFTRRFGGGWRFVRYEVV